MAAPDLATINQNIRRHARLTSRSNDRPAFDRRSDELELEFEDEFELELLEELELEFDEELELELLDEFELELLDELELELLDEFEELFPATLYSPALLANLTGANSLSAT